MKKLLISASFAVLLNGSAHAVEVINKTGEYLDIYFYDEAKVHRKTVALNKGHQIADIEALIKTVQAEMKQHGTEKGKIPVIFGHNLPCDHEITVDRDDVPKHLNEAIEITIKKEGNQDVCTVLQMGG